jgi:acyltransferase-like protein
VSAPAPGPPRRRDIDALRIGACLTQFVYHTGKVFDTDPVYHVKNDILSSAVTAITTFTHLWRMPLFFVLAGWAAATVLRHQDTGAFRRGRVRRLGPPLLFGIVVLCPPIKYVERLTGIDNRPSGHYPGEPFALGFLEFLPRFFGNIRDFSWSHLWFLAYLLMFSLLLAPVLRWIAGRDRLDGGRWLAYPPLAPLVLLETTFRPVWGSFPNLYGDWASIAVYLTYFLTGALLARDARVDTLASECCGLGLLGLAALGVLATADSLALRNAAAAVAGWGSVGFLAGASRRWWRYDGPSIRYLSEATLPLYVLHHTPSVLLAFVIVGLPLGLPGKLTLLLLSSVLATFALYHACVRPWAAMRFWLGMRPPPRPLPAAVETAPLPRAPSQKACPPRVWRVG